MRGASASLVALLCLSLQMSGTAQSLSALTVPAAALPNGCTIGAPQARTPWIPFPTNPWSGTDRKLMTEVRSASDGYPRMPDGPPLSAREAQAFQLKLADDVVEAYQAQYAWTDGSQVSVSALTFRDATLAGRGTLLESDAQRGVIQRIVRGATVVRVTAPARTACLDAVRAHIESIKRASKLS